MLRRSTPALFLSKMGDRVKNFAEKMQREQDEAEKNPLDKPTFDPLRSVKSTSADAKARNTCPRSVLFVPGSNEKALRKARVLNPDVLMLDLEDSVPPLKKAEARENVVLFLKDGLFDGKRCVIRINSPRTNPKEGFLDLDALSVIEDRIEGVAIPKTTLEDYDILSSSVHPDLDLWAFFETPLSIIQAPNICASQKYRYAVMGTNDLSADLQLPHSTPEDEASAIRRVYPRLPLHYHLSSVVNAARAYGVHPIDGVFNDPSDSQGFKREAVEGKGLAFSGKTLIHPAQIPLCHDTFSPSAEEVAWATKIVTGVVNYKRAQAEAEGRSDWDPATDDDGKFGGVIVVDGKMVESMHYDHAVRVLQRHGGDKTDAEKKEDEKIYRKISREGKATRRKPQNLETPEIFEVPPTRYHELDPDRTDPGKRLPAGYEPMPTDKYYQPKDSQ